MKRWCDIFPENEIFPSDIPIIGLYRNHEHIPIGEGVKVFFAVCGPVRDGHDFIDAAIKRGATAIVGERLPELPSQVRGLEVSNAAIAWAEAQRNWYDFPDRALRIFGVTGTSGKTTTVHAIRHLLGERCGCLGTVEIAWTGHVEPAGQTTPDAQLIFSNLQRMADAGCDSVGLEVSSHGLVQERVFGIPFECAIFTNLSRDHLDFHGDMDAYFDAKLRLFDGRNGSVPKCAIINGDDPHGRKLITLFRGQKCVTVGKNATSDWQLLGCESTGFGMTVHFIHAGRFHSFSTALLGTFNAMNLLHALAAVANAYPGRLAEFLERMSTFAPVCGRLQRIAAAGGGEIFIDFAHSPEALKQTLMALRQFCKGGLWTLFGCGGDRDRGKRPQMAKIAETNSDFVIVTDDNPRSEAPEAIVGEIIRGFRGKNYRVIHNRRDAIFFAINSLIKHRGTLLIAGKGHERQQIFSNRTTPFSDMETATECLKQIKHGCLKNKIG
ncbi:MAG: UDP-N-acetylmuramoyl-L-alanyl-D-glutamate--2,6-diaminopimelate ligase [Puniceicoccales bacterium]|jgi:UDP-N-acetylmuramoyl-L-alanyl-D-glutamate--2,6-diaminopimelate ligase|nr:UDP-N-acetylmuramoyl-L-alanyl-D-glutamate--2,6-diaminopimelate ligase [Puniceicoccales bacterium]